MVQHGVYNQGMDDISPQLVQHGVCNQGMVDMQLQFVQHGVCNQGMDDIPPQNPRGAAAGGYLDGNVGAFSSPPSSYYNYNNIQRSVSSHSLPMRLQPGDVSLGGRGFYSPSSPSAHQLTTTLPPLSSSPSSSSGELFEFTSPCPVRRVFSTGDLQGMNGSSPPRPVPSADGCGHEGGGTFSQKVARYSAVERKERIERYRVKRHQRNFNKKIT
ncbi:hypothetical protein ACJX0J_035898, partial [Zea mays]